jgi:hypothetical protein
MSRTYRTYTDSWFRNMHNRKRILSEKAALEAGLKSGDVYGGIEVSHVNKLIIRGSEIPPDDWDDFAISGTREIYPPKSGRNADIGLVARRFMKNHKCSYHAFKNALNASFTYFDKSELSNNNVIFQIQSD